MALFVLLGALWLLYASAVKTKSQKVGWLHGLLIVNIVLYSFTLNGGLDMRALLIMITLLLIIWQVTVLPPVFFTFILLMGMEFFRHKSLHMKRRLRLYGMNMIILKFHLGQ